MNCPCFSGQAFDRCCGRFITHCEPPENALQLMRSRFSAFVLENAEYLLASWHPGHRPARLEFDPLIRWLGLEIINSEQKADEAWVEFEARFLRTGRVESMHELSHFMRQDRWFYTSGEMLLPGFKPWKPARNESCPCGSGLKFKRCCAVR